MKIKYLAFATILTLLISGCDNRPKATSEKTPFSIGGIYLGISKNELQKEHKLLSCDPDKNEKAKCFVDRQDKNYDFFGTSVNFIEVKLYSPYTHISEIHFSTKGGKVSKELIENSWKIHGKCLGYSDIKNASEFDKDTSGYFIRSLNEFNLIPNDYGDFVCLTDKSEFIKYNTYKDKSDAGVDIYFLKEVFTRNFEYLYKSTAKYNQAKEEINRKLNPPTPKKIDTSKISGECEKYNREKPEFDANIDHLIKASEYSAGGTNKYFESFVWSLCEGLVDEYTSLVESGFISKKDAESISKKIGLKLEFPEISNQIKLYQETRSALINLRICNACADNAAMLYSKNKNSECGQLVQSALNGNKKSAEEIDNFPEYCKAYN